MQRTSTKGVQVKAPQDGKGDPLGIEQEIEICTYYQVVFSQARICCKDVTRKILWDFEIQMDYLTLERRPYLVLTNQPPP